jgi:hypothetical protein
MILVLDPRHHAGPELGIRWPVGELETWTGKKSRAAPQRHEMM